MTEIDYADGMRWFDIPVQYPKRPQPHRTETLRVFARDADTARAEADDDVWNRLAYGQGKPTVPSHGADYILGNTLTPTAALPASDQQDWIVVASLNDRGDSHGTVLFGPYASAAAAEADAQLRVLRHQARLGYRAGDGEIVPIVRRTTPTEAAQPQWLTKPHALDDPPPPPGRYASATSGGATPTAAP